MSPDQNANARPRLTVLTGGASSENSTAKVERLQISPEVARALGAGTVMRLRADTTLTEFVCEFCDQADSLDNTEASVIAARYANGISLVRFAHSECSPSAVLTILRRPEPPDHRVHAACWLRPTGLAPKWTSRAVLVISQDLRAWPHAQANHAGDLFSRALYSAGFAQLTDHDQAPASLHLLSITVHAASPADDYDAHVVAEKHAKVVVEHPNGLLFDGDLDVPGRWQQEANAQHRVVVLTGTGINDDLTALSNDHQPDLTTGRFWAALAVLRTDAPQHHSDYLRRRT